MALVDHTERLPVSAADFLRLPESDFPTELIEGKVVMSSAPEVAHQRVVYRVAKLVDRVSVGGETFISPLDVHIDHANVVQPDVFWVANGGACQIARSGRYMRGVPNLIAEVLSPRSARRDRREKFRLYERFGVDEYWMIDPLAHFFEVWQKQDQRLIQIGVFGPGESFTSAILAPDPLVLNGVFG